VLELKSFISEDGGRSLGVAGYLVSTWAKWLESVSSYRVEPALDGYLEESGKLNRNGI